MPHLDNSGRNKQTKTKGRHAPATGRTLGQHNKTDNKTNKDNRQPPPLVRPPQRVESDRLATH